MLSYEIRKLDDTTIQQLIILSKLWVEEDCSYGMAANQKEDLGEPLVVAIEGDKIVGYSFGHFYRQEKKTSYIEPGSRCFSVDELYVIPEYRRKGIGKRLFEMLEHCASKECSYITLSTSTKDYKGILKLYVEDLGMNFHSAFLIKNVPEHSQEGAL